VIIELVLVPAELEVWHEPAAVFEILGKGVADASATELPKKGVENHHETAGLVGLAVEPVEKRSDQRLKMLFIAFLLAESFAPWKMR
jgi:hypothetical protein